MPPIQSIRIGELEVPLQARESPYVPKFYSPLYELSSSLDYRSQLINAPDVSVVSKKKIVFFLKFEI